MTIKSESEIPIVSAQPVIPSSSLEQQEAGMVEAPTAGAQRTLSMVAPSDMQGGYEFYADAGDGKSYKVRVVSTKKEY